MDTRQLKAFVSVAGTHSFTRSAEMLGYAQSSVTGQVASLERELGVKLFERLGRRVILTGEGKRLMAYAKKILHLIRQAEEAVPASGEPAGALVIGAPETLSAVRLPPLVREFQGRYPGVEIVVRECRARAKEITTLLRSGEIDVAFGLGEEITAADLVTEMLGFEPVVLVAAPRHPMTGKIPVAVRDVQDVPLVLCEEGCGYRLVFERILQDAGIRPGPVLEFGSIDAIKKCVAHRMGITVLPRMAVQDELRRGELTDLQWRGPDLDTEAWLLHHKDKWISPAIASFLTMVRESWPKPAV